MNSNLDLSFTSPGQPTLEVSVTDILPVGHFYDDPITVVKTWEVTVHPEGINNAAPLVVSTTEDTRVPHDGSPETSETVVELSVDGSDIDGHELTYQWLHNGQIISDILADNSFSYEVPGYGSYEFNVEVCDCYDCTVETVEVFVDEELNEYPIAGAGEDRIIDLNGSWECDEESDYCEFIYQDKLNIFDNSFINAILISLL